MNQEQLPPPQLLLAIAALEARARAADSLNSLAFSIVNDPHPLLAFRQALVFDCGKPSWSLMAVSGLARPTEDSPYLVWLKQATDWLSTQNIGDGGEWISFETNELPDELKEGWQEWWPSGIWCLKLVDRNNLLRGVVVYLLDAPPASEIANQIVRLSASWSYCWAALDQKKHHWSWRTTSKQKKIAALIAAVICLLPIRQTALAPAEVIGMDAVVIASPLDGVVKTLHVRPNQPVKKGDPLFSLDETTLRNRLEVSMKSIAVADAELNAASQRSFDNAQGRNDIALLGGRSQEKRAELAAIQAQLSRVDVLATRDGVAVFGDPNDWIGKPVVTGERIMLLADPAQPAMLLNLPVADAIALEVGAPVKLYLSAHPLSSIEGRVTETSYQAITTTDGIVAYRLRASIDDKAPEARLGLRGTAKVYGGWVVLGYYILRRPLAAARAWSGL